MEILSYVALIFLSVIGYSCGAVGKAGKSADLKPQLIDLVVVLIILGGAIYTRVAYNLNKWLMIIIWVIVSASIGIISTWPRKLSRENLQYINDEKTSFSLVRRTWHGWKNFSKSLGSFQSRILLSLFFFILVTPFALRVKIFSDPLNTKSRRSKTHWIPKRELKMKLEQFKRQF